MFEVFVGTNVIFPGGDHKNEKIGARSRSTCRVAKSSKPGEFHPQLLTEPYVNVSAHTALGHAFEL